MYTVIKACNNRLMELLQAENIPVAGEHTIMEEISLRDSMEELRVEFSHYPNGIIEISFIMVGKVYYPI